MPKLDPRFIPAVARYIHMRSGETCWIVRNSLDRDELILTNAEGVEWVVSRQIFEDEYKNMPEFDGVMVKNPAPSGRERILEEAIKIVTQDRNQDYGDPEDNFRDIAEFWNIFLSSRGKINMFLTPSDVAAMMVLMKVSRIKTSPDKKDHWIDIAGYAACGGGMIHEPEHLHSKEEGHST